MLRVIEPEEMPFVLEKGFDPSVIFCGERAAAAVVPYTASTLRKSRTEGTLAGRKAPPFHKFGRSVLYRLDELVAWRDAVVKAQ